jgi:hypothetical protein
MNDFNLRKYLAEGKLLKEEVDISKISKLGDYNETEDSYKYKDHFVQKYIDGGKTIYAVFKDRGEKTDSYGSPDFESSDLKKVEDFLTEKGNPGLQENINMATILSHDDYHDLYIGNKAEHDARDEEEQFSGEYMIDLDPGMYQMIFWDNDGPGNMSFNNKLDYVKGAIRNFWGEDHFIEKFGIQDEVGDDNWDYFDQHTEDNLDMYYEELNNLINKSYPDGDSANGVVLLVNGKVVAGEAAEI